jgi:iron complex outermembrane receptor protein
VFSVAQPWRGSTSSSNLSGKVGLQYDIVPESTGYATYSRGYKGPAYNVFFNLTATGIGPIEPETVNAFELGLKNSLFGGKMALNFAAWYAKYYDYQANNPDIVAGVVVTRLTNAGNVSTRGASVDLIWRPTTNLSFSGGVAYTNAHVDQFKVPPGGNPAAVVPSGTQLVNAPEWKMSLGGNYTIETGGFANVNLGFQSAYQSSQLSQLDASAAVRAATTIPAYGILDLTAGLASPDGRWSLLGTVKNVFDQSFAASITTGGPGGSLRYIIPREADRYWGLTARVGF